MNKRFLRILTAMIALLCAISCASAEEDGTLRVRLTRPGTLESLMIRADCDYTVNENGTAIPAGTNVEVSLKNGALTLTANGAEIASGVTLTLKRAAGGNNGFTFEAPALSHVYRGDLNLTASGSVITPILTIDVEDYVAGVTAETLPESTGSEAMKAEAIAARSYALCKREAAAGAAYDLTDSSADQLFTGFDVTRSDAVSAAEQTRGQVLYADGKIAACYTTRSNGGVMESAENVWGVKVPYTAAQTDAYDAESGFGRSRSVTIFKNGDGINPDTRKALLEGIYPQLEAWGLSTADKDITITSIDSIEVSDPVNEGGQCYAALNIGLSVTGVNLSSGKPVRCSANVSVPTYGGFETWNDLSINDSDNETVSVTSDSDSYTILFRRDGHGIGMSLGGAKVMAENYGRSCEDILNYYYPNTETRTLSLSAPAAPVIAERTAGSGDSAFALPTLVPVATPAPTDTPQPTVTPVSLEVTFIEESPLPEFTAEPEPTNAPEPEPTRSVPPLFADLPSSAPAGSDFIAGAVQSEATTAPAATSPFDPATREPTLKPTQKPTAKPVNDDPDEIEVFDLPTNFREINYNVDDSVLGPKDRGGDPFDPDTATKKPSATKTPAPGKIDFTEPKGGDIVTNGLDEDAILGPKSGAPESDILGPSDNLDEDAILGPMDNAYPDGDSSMRSMQSAAYGIIKVEEGSTLTLREAPSVSAEAIDWIANGDVVRVRAYNDSWLAVTTRGGVKGYVARAYVTRVNEEQAKAAWARAEQRDAEAAETEPEENDPEPAFEDLRSKQTDIVICDFMAYAKSNVRLHTLPDVNAPTLATIGEHEYVHVSAYNGAWAYVEYADFEGFVARDYLKKG